MKRVLLTALAVVFATGISLSCFAQTPTDYKTAYQAAQDGNKPLLVLVTAEWCPPCKVMKNTTIPELMQKQAFKNFHYSTVDLDQDEKLARQLIGNRGVPQLIMYERKNDKWIRRYLRGIQTPATVEAFVAQAGIVRTANVSSNLVDK